MLTNVALITIVQNGNEFFKIWYKYYTKFIPIKNIYVVNFNSNDGSTDNLDCNVLNFEGCSIENVPQGNEIINKLKTELLKNFKYVIYTDYDEILFHPKGLETVISSNQRYYTPFGYEIVQNRHLERPLNFTQSILSQRNYWYRYELFDKPLVTSIDFNWSLGNHSATLSSDGDPNHNYQNAVLQPNYIADFYLIHLHKVDYKHCLALNEKNVKEGKVPKNGGSHNFLLGESFEKWWKHAENQLVLIPPSIKNDILL